MTQAQIPAGDDRFLEADFSKTATNHGTTVSSVDWSIVQGDDKGTLGNPYLIESSSIVLLNTSTTPGKLLIKATATMADTQTFSVWFGIESTIPEV